MRKSKRLRRGPEGPLYPIRAHKLSFSAACEGVLHPLPSTSEVLTQTPKRCPDPKHCLRRRQTSFGPVTKITNARPVETLSCFSFRRRIAHLGGPQCRLVAASGVETHRRSIGNFSLHLKSFSVAARLLTALSANLIIKCLFPCSPDSTCALRLRFGQAPAACVVGTKRS